MRTFLPALFFLLTLPFAAVAGPTDTVRTWFDKDWKETTADNAIYSRKQWKKNKLFFVRDYYRDGQLQMSGSYSDAGLEKKEGDFRYFFENGSLSSAGKFHRNGPDGAHQRWYENGVPADSEYYKAGELDGPQIWYHKNGRKSEQGTYKAGEPVRVKLWRDDGTIDPDGKPGEVMAEFITTPAGNLADFLKRRLRYPETSRSKGAEGKAIVEFIIDADGTVSECAVAKSSGIDELDEEALRVVRTMPKWRPAKQHNRPVRMFFTLPVTFRLK